MLQRRNNVAYFLCRDKEPDMLKYKQSCQVKFNYLWFPRRLDGVLFIFDGTQRTSISHHKSNTTRQRIYLDENWYWRGWNNKGILKLFGSVLINIFFFWKERKGINVYLEVNHSKHHEHLFWKKLVKISVKSTTKSKNQKVHVRIFWVINPSTYTIYKSLTEGCIKRSRSSLRAGICFWSRIAGEVPGDSWRQSKQYVDQR